MVIRPKSRRWTTLKNKLKWKKNDKINIENEIIRWNRIKYFWSIRFKQYKKTIDKLEDKLKSNLKQLKK